MKKLRDNQLLTPDYVDLIEAQHIAIFRTVPCRWCLAPRHKPCITVSGFQALFPHASRKDDWRDILEYFSEQP